MTLFIAFLLIYGLELNPYLYALAIAIWFAHLAFQFVKDV